MKSAYELAMERLTKSAPSTKLPAGHKARLAELESKYKARIAEREIGLRDEMVKAAAAGEREQVRELEQRLVHERRKLRDELEAKKEAVRHKAG
jgi:septin family protein